MTDSTPDDPDAATEPDDPYAGHEFEYESHTDLFRCSECRVYEVVARHKNGTITPCAGLIGWGGDTERVYLLLDVSAGFADQAGVLATRVRGTGIGRTPRFSWHERQLVVESAPSVVAGLIPTIEAITYDVGGGLGHRRAVSSIRQLSADEGRAVIARNRAAYIAKYGAPA